MLWVAVLNTSRMCREPSELVAGVEARSKTTSCLIERAQVHFLSFATPSSLGLPVLLRRSPEARESLLVNGRRHCRSRRLHIYNCVKITPKHSDGNESPVSLHALALPEARESTSE